jgi:hypothetical protein
MSFAGCGVVKLGTASQHGRAAFRATCNRVQESRRAESKHGRRPAADKWSGDGSVMESDGMTRALMAECAAGSR